MKMSTAEFAKLFNPPASDSLVSRWERGVNLPNNTRLERIAEIGNITVDELIYGYSSELKSTVEKHTEDIMNIEIRELGSEKYKMLYDPYFKKDTIKYMLKHFSFDGLTDIGIRNYTKKLLDIYLDRKQFESKYEPHSNQNAIRYTTDSLLGTAMESINNYFRADDSSNLFSHLLNKEDIKQELSYDLYCKILSELENTLIVIDNLDDEN
jgi:transcriptional regulator with XRE-family HTH domain